MNLAAAQPNPYKSARSTGIGKCPSAEPVLVRAPGPKHEGLGSGLVGDFIGDRRHHGGDDQAVYAFAREDLDHWQAELALDLPNGHAGAPVIPLVTVAVTVRQTLAEDLSGLAEQAMVVKLAGIGLFVLNFAVCTVLAGLLGLIPMVASRGL